MELKIPKKKNLACCMQATSRHRQFSDFDHLASELDYQEECDSYYKSLDSTFVLKTQDQATHK